MKNIEIIIDDVNVARFKENKLVSYLLEKSGEDMNKLARMHFSKDDQMQFAQLIGYSVSGYGDLPYASKKSVRKADKKVDEIINGKKNERP